MTENMPFSESFWNRRLTLIYRIILLGLGLQMLLSWPLWWTPNGVLPYLPIISFHSQWLEKTSLVLFPIFLILLSIGLALPKKSVIPKLLLLTGFLLILGNIHRLQVWFYFYGLILFLFSWKKIASSDVLLWIIRLVLIGIYGWSGLHKLNIQFVEDIFPWLIEPLGFVDTALPAWLAYGAGGVEVLIGIGLLFRPTRNFSVLGSMLFHGLILGLLGPLGHNWNMVVWPWNLVMPLLVFFLFYNTQQINFKNLGAKLRSFLPGLLVLSLVWILPGFNYLGFTPEQLSFKMYAGSQPEMVLYFGETDRHLLGSHPTIYSVLPPDTTPHHRVVLDDVAFAEWGTPLFTTPRTAQMIKKDFCLILMAPEEGGMLYLVDDDFVRIPCWKGK